MFKTIHGVADHLMQNILNGLALVLSVCMDRTLSYKLTHPQKPEYLLLKNHLPSSLVQPYQSP